MPNYVGKITRNTDWGGDESTGYLPVAGESVQSHLKEELGGKIGAVYKPEGENKVYYFTTQEDKEAFIRTSDESYVAYSYELESNYDIEVETDSYYHSILKGATGNSLSFKFKIVNKQGMTTDATAKIELSFTGSGVSTKFTNEIPMMSEGWTTFNLIIDDYLREGVNNVTVKITGMSSKANTQFVMTYNVFNLDFQVNFDYNVVKTGRTMTVPFSIQCSDPKYVEFFIDGVQVSPEENMYFPDPRHDGEATLDISQLTPGQHSLQVRGYVRSSDNRPFYTPVHFYTFAKYGDAPTSFLIHRVSEDGTVLVREGEGLKMSLTQFEQIKFDWSTYDKRENIRLNVKFEYDGNVISTAVVNGNETINTFSYRPMDYGTGKTLSIYALTTEGDLIFNYDIDLDVAETSSGIKETTSQLIFKLNANGKRNSDDGKDVWEYRNSGGNTYFAKFSGFTWNSQNGWDEETESLVISNGATVSFFYKTEASDEEFPVTPMSNNWATGNGGALELDFEVFDVDNEDAVILECKNNAQDQEAFIRLTATKAEFSTAQGIKVNTRYRDNERLKIVFIGNPHGTREDDKLIYLVVNGVLERAAMYNVGGIGDIIQSVAGLTIGDPNGQCKVRLRSIRYYNRAISVDEAFNNYVVDSDDVQGIYEKNDVIKTGFSNEIGFDKVANKLPVMIFTGDMNKLVTEGQATKTTSGKWYYFDVEYINRQEPERNFVAFNCRMKLQGTSSLGYPRKNFKLNTKDKNFDQSVYDNSNYELDPTSEVGNLQLRNKVTKERIDFADFNTEGTLGNTRCFMLDYEGKALKKGKYRFRANAHKAQKWTLKADFMESSCSHNVGAGRSWNDIFENTPLSTPDGYVDQTYKDSALALGENRQYNEYYGTDIEGKTQHYKIPYNTDEIKNQKKYVCRTDAQKICHAENQDDIRTAVDGFPMVCFYRTSHADNDLVFLGQYNFINDKSSYEVFGFEDIEHPNDEETMIYDASKVEVFEGLKNSNALSLFETVDGFNDWNADHTLKKWAETYESRYPDQEDAETDPVLANALNNGLQALYDLSEWLVSTRHEEDTVYNGRITVDATFAKHINECQYGYSSATTELYQYAEGEFDDSAEARQKKFETEKWEHFDVWKLAGYYIYLMRYGAVDQFVKNTMLFTDGNGRYDSRTDLKYRKWFFINYDNDCLFGLRNNGQLAFHWDMNRQTVDAGEDIIVDDQVDETGTNSYAMMGHSSTLWNNLERDEEFMRMVRDLDNSMTMYKLTYDNMVKEFDTEQTEKWCERIYNANERYKYIQAAKGIGDMEGRAVDNLWMLQGTRRSHRHWWIANRFALLNAQWLSGDYKETYVQMKVDSPAGVGIHAVAGMNFYYAWGEDKKIFESNIVKKEGDPIHFIFQDNQVQGNPCKIYAFNKLSEIDFSEISKDAHNGTFEFKLTDKNTQNFLKKLVIGNPDWEQRNTRVSTTTSWVNVPNLEYLDITNYTKITSVPLEAFKNLHTFKAAGTILGSFAPADGCYFNLVELPNTISTMRLNNLSFEHNINTDLVYTVNTNLSTLEISNNHEVGLDYYNKLVRPWIMAIEASPQWSTLYRTSSLTVRNIKWSFGSLDDIRLFKNFSTIGNLNLSGVIDLRSCGNLSRANIEEIKDIFGQDCFNQELSSLYIITPDSVFIESSKDSMVAGQTHKFERIIYPDERAIQDKINLIQYYIVRETNKDKSQAEPGETIFDDTVGNKKYLVIDDLSTVRSGLSLTNELDENGKQIGVLRCSEYVLGHDDTFKVLVYMNVMGADQDKVSVMDFTVKDPTYATNARIDGVKSLYTNKEYRFTLAPMTANGSAPIGSYTVDWSVSGTALSRYIDSYGVDPNDQLTFIVTTNANQPDESEISSDLGITATINNYIGAPVSTSFRALVLNEHVILTIDSNPAVMNIMHSNGLARNEFAMTKEEAESATTAKIGTIFRNQSSEFSFLEFKYFTGVTALTASAFEGSNITEIALPETLTNFGLYCFNNCTSLRGVYVAEENQAGTEILYVPTLPYGTTTVSEGMFRNCRSLNELTLPNSVTQIEDFAFGGTGFNKALLHDAELSAGVLRLSDYVVGIAGDAFETEKWSPETTTNKLTRLELPATYRISATHCEVLGRNFSEFYVAPENPSILSENGVLFDYSKETFLRYPPKKEYVETFTTAPAMFISQYAFFAVEGIDDLIFGSNVTNISTGACRESSVKYVDLGETSITELRYDTFMSCHELETVILPTAGSLYKLGRRLFYDCPKLANINLPESITEFEADGASYTYTFAGCHSLSAIVFPTRVEKMGIYTVYNCRNLEEVVFPTYLDYTSVWRGNDNGTIVTQIVVDGELVSVNKNVPIAIIGACGNLSRVTLPVSSYDVDDGEGNITSVDYNTLYMSSKKWWQYYETPTSTQPRTPPIEGLSLIDKDSRGNITGYYLPDVDNGDKYVSIDGVIYESDRRTVTLAPNKRTHIDLEPTVEIIGDCAFYQSSIETLGYGSGITVCNENSFDGCGNFISSGIVKNLVRIGNLAFNGVGFTEVEFGERLTSIPRQLFDGSSRLSKITFNNFNGSIAQFAFRNNRMLQTIVVSGQKAPMLTNIWAGDSESLGWYQFGGAGTSVSNKQVIVSLGTAASFTRTPGTSGSDPETTYNPEVETTWNHLFTNFGYTLVEGIPLDGVGYVKVFVNGQPYSNPVIWTDDDSLPYDSTEEGYMFALNGLLDGQEITLYTDENKTNAVGTFIPRIEKFNYQVGTPSLSMGKSRALSAPAPEDTEMADITKDEYNALTSKVNQLMKIIKGLTK